MEILYFDKPENSGSFYMVLETLTDPRIKFTSQSPGWGLDK